jgi:hypothetical protein
MHLLRMPCRPGQRGSRERDLEGEHCRGSEHLAHHCERPGQEGKNMHRNNAVGEYEYKVIDAKSIGNH